MGREDSPYIVGEFWLDKRRDANASDIWQIATYLPEARTVRYRSTRCRGLEDAKRVIEAHHARVRAEGPQRAEDAAVVPLLMLYWQEKGCHAIGPGQIASSLRAFIAFLGQDKAGLAVTVADLNPALFERYRVWRMAPHGYNLRWEKRDYSHTSKGVKGESVQRNLDDVRAALNHHVSNGRIPFMPKVPAVPSRYRSPPRDRVLSYDELGAMIGYAAYDLPLLRFILLMLATGARPEAALRLDVGKQYDRDRGLLNLQHPDAPRTKKRNPVIPVIPEFRPWLEACDGPWLGYGSMKTRWRTMRRTLGLSDDVVAKTIRHTVATRLRSAGVNHLDISAFLGHVGMSRVTAVYAKYDPDYMRPVSKALSAIWRESCSVAHAWLAVHLLSKEGNGERKVIDKYEINPQHS